ncbi:MAG: metallophosphoesterase [Muribaculaceae bacterium]|nr:metallophosphoesterase [Muribaculaceae bacterium]
MKFFNSHFRMAMTVALACFTMVTMAQKRLFVFSDPHLLASGLFHPSSSALQNDLAGDNKMFDKGNEIMQSMVNTILTERPDAVLVPGDLTKQGAKLSHMAMAACLKQVTDAGIKVFVIPGNHDVNNKQAVRYDGANKYQAATVTSSEFVELYNDMGFAAAIARDNNSLSYVAEPVPGLRLIAVDDSRCTARDYNPSLNANGLTMSTRSWVCSQIDEAHQLGKQVIIMMHHNLIEHIDDQATFSGDAQVTQAQAIRNEWLQHGSQLVLTGHMHISNISTWHNEARTDSIVEISTGSAIAYPCHYRIIELSPDLGTFQVSTGCITQVQGIDNFPAYAEQRMAGSARATISSIVYSNWDTFNSKLQEYQPYLGNMTFTQESVTDIAYRNMAGAVTLLNKTMAEGNENEKDGQAIRDQLNTAATNFASDLLSEANPIIQIVAVPLIVDQFNQMLETPLNSALNDCTGYGTDHANVTDDLHPTLHFTPVEIPVEIIRGDLNGDGVVDVTDVNILINVILGVTESTEIEALGDLTGDNAVDVSDVNVLINIILAN